MKFSTQPLFVASILILGGNSVTAHHSTSTYDVGQEVTIQGIVTRVQWANPHVFIYMSHTDDSGSVLNWAVEGLNPASMRRLGWSRDTLALGEIVTVTGNPSKNMTSPAIYPKTIFNNGRKLFDEGEFYAGAFAPAEKAETGASSLAGVWKIPLTPGVILPPATEAAEQVGSTGIHDVTEKGLEALAQFDELTMNPAINCTQIPAPLIMHFGDYKHIEINEDEISIRGDYDGGERIIHMGLTSHSGAEPSNQGHSIGRWEGATLVIDTSHFAQNNFGNGFGLPSSSQKHLTERLTLAPDGKTLAYEFNATDPEYLASAMSYETEWVYQPDEQVVIDGCSLESARRFQLN